LVSCRWNRAVAAAQLVVTPAAKRAEVAAGALEAPTVNAAAMVAVGVAEKSRGCRRSA
jgi:hypothetical protein